MTQEIWVENRRVDCSEGLPNLITYSVDDLRDIQSRTTTFSKTIVLPGTVNNNTLFGSLFDVAISNPEDISQPNIGSNFNARRSASCIIFQDHVQVFKGIFRILKMTITDGMPEYECAVFGELGGLINSIGNGKLEDIDFSVYDHVFGVSSITGSWDNTSGAGYYYPLADYGLVSTNKKDYDISAFRPALYVREYIDKILTDAGYDYDFPLMDTPRFKSLIIPNNQKTFQKLSNQQLDVRRNVAYVAISDLGPAPPQKLKFDDLAVLGSFSANVDNNEFTFGGSDTIQTFFNIELNLQIYGQFYTFGFKLLKNGSPIYDFGDIYRSSPATLDIVLQVSDLPVDISNGDVFAVEITATNTGGGLGTWGVNVNEAIWTIVTTNATYIDINPGDTVTISDTIPRNILQIDFLASILRLFNLYVSEDKDRSNFLHIYPYVDFFNVSGTPTDWTYKMDRSKPQEITPMSELTARFYDFKMKDDSDYYNELYKKRYSQNYGDYIFDSEYVFSPDRGSVELIFAGTPLVGYSGADKIVPAYYKRDSNGEQQNGTVIRILQSKKITGVSSWKIQNGGVDLVSLTDYGYAGHYDDPDAPANDIHFGVPKELFFTLLTGAINVTQFNVYWSPYMAEITDKDSRLLSAYFKLSNQDIYNLDFGTFVYVDGSLFRLKSVQDFNTTEPDVTKCELLKVINKIY